MPGTAPNSKDQSASLARPARIADQEWPEAVTPIVSICCLTYNQERFVRDCLDGLLMQETTFPVEIVIHDDASTDDTANIIREYQARHPQIIKPIYQTENQYSKVRHPDVVFNFPRSRGKYIALCEGDDYWTATDKLQTQVDLMESHPEYSGCFHNVSFIFEDGSQISRPQYARPLKDRFTVRDLVENNYVSTPSALFRTRLFSEFPDWYAQVPVGDWPLHVLNAEHGDIGYIDRVLAAYRVHPGGVWSSLSEAERSEVTIQVANILDAHLGFRHTRAIRKLVAYCHYQIAVHLGSEGRDDRAVLVHLAASISSGFFDPRISKSSVAVMLVKHAAPAIFRRLQRIHKALYGMRNVQLTSPK